MCPLPMSDSYPGPVHVLLQSPVHDKENIQMVIYDFFPAGALTPIRLSNTAIGQLLHSCNHTLVQALLLHSLTSVL